MADLVLGPVLRYVGQTEATVWVEADGPCKVEVLGARTPTFAVEGHHFALVHVTGLPSGEGVPYAVRLDGEQRWPREGAGPPSLIRTQAPDDELRLAFGSCRLTVPHHPPFTLSKDADDRGRESDALRALSQRMQGSPSHTWPHALLLLGDQVYADEVPPGVAAFIRATRDVREPPGEQVQGFEEYCRLYWEAWGEPSLRWLLANVPSAMIFDDHDVHDDWNTSESWVAEMRALPWWSEHMTGALMSYWLYQHLGNLSPVRLAQDALFGRVRGGGDASAHVRAFAERAGHEVTGSRWSYCRDLGTARLVVLDSRAGRVLRDGRRAILDDDHWAWVEEHATGDVDHLLLATSLPFLLGPGMHHLEACNEAVCAGAWGPLAANLGERVRRALDLEHWAAFGGSFARLAQIVEEVAAGERGRSPASIVTLSGDVHHAYLAEVGFRAGAGVRSSVFQAVCSPFRNPLNRAERRVVRAGWSPTASRVGRALARAAGVADPPIGWRLTHAEPWFDNQVAMLTLDGRHASFALEKAPPGDAPVLEEVFTRLLV